MKSENNSLSSCFVINDKTSVMNAEILFKSFLLEHNVPLAASGCNRNLLEQCSDSEICMCKKKPIS